MTLSELNLNVRMGENENCWTELPAGTESNRIPSVTAHLTRLLVVNDTPLKQGKHELSAFRRIISGLAINKKPAVRRWSTSNLSAAGNRITRWNRNLLDQPVQTWRCWEVTEHALTGGKAAKKSLGIQTVREGKHISKMLLELVFLSISYKGTKTAHSNCFEVFKSLVICRDRTTRPNDLQAVTCALLDHHTDSNSVFIADSKGWRPAKKLFPAWSQ